MEATTKHSESHGFWVLVELSQRLLWASEFQGNMMTEPEETPKSKHSKAFLQHPDDPGLLFPFSAPWLCPYIIFRTPTSEPSNSWPMCAGQVAVPLEKLGHVTDTSGQECLVARNWQARHGFSLVKAAPVPHADGSQKRSSSEPCAGVGHGQSCAEAIFCPGMISIGLYWFKSWLPCLECLSYWPQWKASGHGA